MQDIQGIKITAPVFDQSGYSIGAFGWIRALFGAGTIPMWINPVSFEQDKPDFSTTLFDINRPEMGSKHDILDALCRTPRAYNINFVRLSPEVGVRYLDNSKVNIISTAWECSHLDPYWVDCCNRFDGVFVESDWAVEVFQNSGVRVPVLCVPNCENANNYKIKTAPKPDSETFKFYSIQQWTERKNGLGLLKAYFNAFGPDDNVLLVLKAYLTRVEKDTNQRAVIADHIKQLKESLNIKRAYPPVYLITDKLTDAEITQMHEECDCYAMLDRGESWGIPYASAAAAGNPIVATNWGGTRQFLNEDNSYCVDYVLDYVSNMSWSPYYAGWMQWAHPSPVHAAELMRYVYDNREEALHRGLNARQTMINYYRDEVIAKRLVEAIIDIQLRTTKK